MAIDTVQMCYNDGVSSPAFVCQTPVSLTFADAAVFSAGAKIFGDSSSPQNYYTIGVKNSASPKVWTGGLIPATGSGDTWQKLTLVFCVYPITLDDNRVFIFGSEQSHFTVGIADVNGGLWVSARGGEIHNAIISAAGSPSDFGGMTPDMWHAVMIAYDGNSTSSPLGRNIKIWIDGSEVFNGVWGATSEADLNPMDWGGPCYVGMGDFAFGTAPGHDPDLWQGLHCYLSYVWAKEQYLDPTTYWSSFFDASNKPIDVGADGSSVTGTAPDTYCPDADFTNNRGTGPNWTQVGTVANAPSSPSD